MTHVASGARYLAFSFGAVFFISTIHAQSNIPLSANTPTPTTEPSLSDTAPVSGAVFIASGLNNNNIGSEVGEVFAAKSKAEYFSPFEIMNPAHMRLDMPMQIAQWNDLHLSMGFEAVGRFQALHQENVVSNGASQDGLNPDFQTPWANLNFLAAIPDKLDVYFDIYLASDPSPDTVYMHEGYLVFKGVPKPMDQGILGEMFNYINVKAGAFDVDFGDDNYRRTNNGRTERNPLIGNPLVDPNQEEIGGEVYSIKGPVYWLTGVSTGTTRQHYDYGAQPAAHGKLWAYPLPDVRTSASVYYVDLDRSNDVDNLFNAGRSGEPFQGVFGGGDDPGQVLPQGGKNMTAVQGDLTWNHWPFEIYSNVGWTQDADQNGTAAGSPSERWIYGTFEPVYHFTPAVYIAGRYSAAEAQAVHGVDTHGWVDRAEGGAGYWFTTNILLKAEYVYEQYHDFAPNTGSVSGEGNGSIPNIEASHSPRFSGGILEMSFFF